MTRSGRTESKGKPLAEVAVGQVRSAPEKTASRDVNQRVMVRYRCAPATPGRVFLEEEDQEFRWVWLINLSQGGAGFLCGKAIPAGTSISLSIKSPDSGRIANLSAHVMHSTQQRDGDFLIGCEFLQALPLEQLDDLL